MVVGALRVCKVNFDFKQKIILVTGSTHGLGFYIGNALLNLGATVIFNSRSNNKRSLKKINNKIIHHFVADVSDEEQAKKMLQKINDEFGLLDHIVCNVGDGSSTNFNTGSLQEMNLMLKRNLYPSSNIVSLAPNHMTLYDGSIVCISSICGKENIGAPVSYQVAKAALNMYVASIAKHLYDYKIRINAVAPGNIFFEGSVWEKKLKENNKEVLEMLQKDVILNRFGTPEDISNFVIFLLSSFSSFSTGKTFVVDGGQTKGL
jgi:3-oxoacyl-[acyl-carrier protein] reductase